MSDSEFVDISLGDVFKFAHDIAEDFDGLVRLNSIDTVRPLVEKVIKVLELLESSVRKIEHFEVTLRDVENYNLQLSGLKVANDQDKVKLKQAFEEAEDAWMQDILALKSQVSSLRIENERLKKRLSVKDESSCEADDVFAKEVAKEQESTILKLRHSLKQKEKQLADSACLTSALNCRIKELLEINRVLHARHQEARKQVSWLTLERNEYQSELGMLKKQNNVLNENLNEFIQCTLTQQKDVPEDGGLHACEELLRADLAHHIQSEMRLLEKIKRLQSELQLEKCLTMQYKEKISKLSTDEKPFSKSKIHHFFHLFLGVN